MSLANNLSKLMKREGIKMSELAQGAGVPYTTVYSLFEKGADNIKLSTLKKLADYFGVTLDELAGETTEDSTAEDWTKEELEEIERFKDYLRSKRGN